MAGGDWPHQRFPAWTDDDTAKLRELHATGASLTAIATIMGRSKSTVSKYARDLGLSFDRARTAKATEAVVVDNKARRQSIVARVYGVVETELGLLENTTTWSTVLKDSGGAERTQILAFVPALDRRNMADSISRHLASATKLEAIDATNGVERERSLLSQLGEALGVHGPEQ